MVHVNRTDLNVSRYIVVDLIFFSAIKVQDNTKKLRTNNYLDISDKNGIYPIKVDTASYKFMIFLWSMDHGRRIVDIEL